MPKRAQSNVRGIAKSQRERERQERKAEKLAKRRDAREQQPQPQPETLAGIAPQSITLRKPE